MKSPDRFPLALAAALLLAFFAPAAAPAQSAAAGGTLNNAAMIKLFGPNTSFTARLEIAVLEGKARKETSRTPMNFSMLDGNVRMEIDLNQIQSPDRPNPAIGYARQLEMDQSITILRPDRKVNLHIYPKLSAYAEAAMSKDEQADFEKNYRIEKTRLGKESVNGHTCTKNKAELKADKGEKQEILLWTANDLKDFPVKIEIPGPDSAVIMSFKDVKLVKTEPRLFEPPTGMTRYDSAEKLAHAVSLKKFGEPK